MHAPTRSRSRPGAILAVVLAVLLAACAQPSNTPIEYDATTKDNFLSGCEEGGGSNDYCACAYEQVVANVPYDDTDTTSTTAKGKGDDESGDDEGDAGGGATTTTIDVGDLTFTELNETITAIDEDNPLSDKTEKILAELYAPCEDAR